MSRSAIAIGIPDSERDAALKAPLEHGPEALRALERDAEFVDAESWMRSARPSPSRSASSASDSPMDRMRSARVTVAEPTADVPVEAEAASRPRASAGLE